MNKDETINKVSSSMIESVSKLKDIRTLSKLIRSHNRDVVTNTVTDKIDSIVSEIENELKNNLKFITSYHYMNNLAEKLNKSAKEAEYAIMTNEDCSLNDVPEDFDAENYDDFRGKYVEDGNEIR